MNVTGELLVESPKLVSGAWGMRWREEGCGRWGNGDELWGTQFVLLRLRSADKHARQVSK